MTALRAADSPEQVVEVLRRWQFTRGTEADLQAGIADALAQSGIEARREVALGNAGRIDLLSGRVGIEVKVAGGPGAVRRQLARYCTSPDVDAVVLVTSRHTHRGLVPSGLLNGKPVLTLWVSGVLR